MTCRCSPSLVRLMADFSVLGHINSGCCGDAAHQARKSDHNPDASGYAHAQDVHEKVDHDMKPFVDFIMANPSRFPQVKYLIYERVIYYPHAAGSRRPGPYAYTGPNAHAAHLHVSIFADFTHYGGDWLVAEAYKHRNDPKAQPAPLPEEEEVKPYLFSNDIGEVFIVTGSKVARILPPFVEAYKARFGDVLPGNGEQLEQYKASFGQ